MSPEPSLAPLHLALRVTTSPPASSSQPRALVAGAGLTGCLAAIALANARWSVVVVDALSREALCRRQRAYALSRSSLALLERLGLHGNLAAHLWGFNELKLLANQGRSQVRFSLHDLRPPSTAAIGCISQHHPLMALLQARLAAHPRITVHLGVSWQVEAPRPLPDLSTNAADWDLIVAADGRGSSLREAAGVGSVGWSYNQSCITLQCRLQAAGATTAWEVFRDEGPLALLPIDANRTQVVWSTSRATATALLQTDTATFSRQLAAALPGNVKLLELLNTPQAFPVGLQLARRFRQHNVLMLGETAHCCHPLGGQGLNLCWRDVDTLHALAQPVGRGTRSVNWLLAAYGRRRRLDTWSTLLVTDVLLRFFANGQPLLVPLRAFAVTLLRHGRQLRRLVLRGMTVGFHRLVG